MAEEKVSNLEPIDEVDKSLAKKFGHVEKKDFDKIGKSMESISNTHEKEHTQESVSAEKDGSYGKILSKIKTKKGVVKNDDVSSDAKDVSLKMDAESQIQHLIDIATNKDVFHAVKVARHLESNYVLDTFHDRLLSDEFHDALVEKGLLK